MGVGVGELMVQGISAMIPVFIIMCVGVLCVRKKILDRRGVQELSLLIKWVFIPCMFFVRLGSGISLELFQKAWVLTVAGVISTGFNFLVAKFILFPLGKPTPEFSSWFLVALVFPNGFALPMIFLSAICRQSDILRPGVTNITATDDPYLSIQECLELGEVYIFLYIVFPTLTLFSLAHLIHRNNIKREASAVQVISESDETSNEPDTDDLVIQNVQGSEEFNSSDSLEKGKLSKKLSNDHNPPPKKSQCVSIYQGVVAVLFQPTISSQLIGIAIGLIKPVQDFFFSGDYFIAPFVNAPILLAPALVPLTNLSLAASLGLKLERISMDKFFGGGGEENASRRTLLVLSFGRMIILPALSILVIYSILDYLPNDQLLQIIMCIEMSVPTANMVVILSQITKSLTQAENLSLSVIHQYFIGIISLSMWVFLALYITTPQ